MYFDHYYPNKTEQEAMLIKHHGRTYNTNASLSCNHQTDRVWNRPLPQHPAPNRSMQSRPQHPPYAMGRNVCSNPDSTPNRVTLLTPAYRTRIPIGLDEGHHQCVQWDRIDAWMQERHINVFEPGMIVHPTLGMYDVPVMYHLISRHPSLFTALLTCTH